MKKRLLLLFLALCMALASLPGTALAVDSERVTLKSTKEVRWIDRVDLPDYALALYETLEEAVDGDGYNDYLIDNQYYDLDGEDIRTDVPGVVMRGTLTSSDGSSTRYTAIVVTTTKTAATDQVTKDYIRNCISAVVSAFKFDHQEVFWIDGRDTVRFERNDGKTYFGLKLCSRRTYPDGETTFFDMRRADFRPGGKWDIRRAMAQRDADVEKILSTIPAGADRFTQLYYINDWLSEYNSFNSLVKGDESGPWYAYECITALEGGTGTVGPVCSGYSAAFKVLCDTLEIPCVTVRGLGNTGGAHRWNYVQMEDGNWYGVDMNYNSDLGREKRTRHLLVGGKTLTVDNREFRLSHVEQNGAYYGGVENFLNGPMLNDEAYLRSARLHYMRVPEKLAPGDLVSITPDLMGGWGADYTYRSTALPAGLSLNQGTGKITGMVTKEADPITVTVTATNSNNPADTAECTLQFPAVGEYSIIFDSNSGRCTVFSHPTTAREVYVAAALYSGSGKLRDIELKSFQLHEGSNSIGAFGLTSKATATDQIKVFLLDAASHAPLCHPK